MTTVQQIDFYQPQIAQLAAYAKRVGYNVETGDILELTRQYLNDSAKANNFLHDNKDEATRIVKRFV